MAEVNRDSGTVNARILYWGVEGGGKSTNLRVIHQKLRPDHRGDLQTRRTRLDPTVTYEVLPIELPGCGRRMHEPSESTSAELIDDVVAQVLARAREPYALFGHSLGAQLALDVAQRLLQQPVPAPLVVFANDELGAWREHTSGGVEPSLLAGGHFFFQAQEEQLLRWIERRLAERSAGAPALRRCERRARARTRCSR